MTSLSVSKARGQFAELINQAAYRGRRVALKRRGKTVAAIVPAEDLAALEALEDRLDIEAAKKALAESNERIPYEKVRKELGL
ncbi:MAG: type II toxin-antitoxin system Phd/YefM family antitoxin [Planctomycetota bacterium]|jgi:prevent-host-death family protein|nr:type II toxin-antitoxin system Phd/YefM family antitoxin [Planctomycetota bacterium]